MGKVDKLAIGILIILLIVIGIKLFSPTPYQGDIPSPIQSELNVPKSVSVINDDTE